MNISLSIAVIPAKNRTCHLQNMPQKLLLGPAHAVRACWIQSTHSHVSMTQSRSPRSVISAVTRLWANQQTGRGSILGTAPQPPIKYLRGKTLSGVKRPGPEAHHSPPSSDEIKTGWWYTSTLPNMLSCMQKNSFTISRTSLTLQFHLRAVLASSFFSSFMITILHKFLISPVLLLDWIMLVIRTVTTRPNRSRAVFTTRVWPRLNIYIWGEEGGWNTGE